MTKSKAFFAIAISLALSIITMPSPSFAVATQTVWQVLVCKTNVIIEGNLNVDIDGDLTIGGTIYADGSGISNVTAEATNAVSSIVHLGTNYRGDVTFTGDGITRLGASNLSWDAYATDVELTAATNNVTSWVIAQNYHSAWELTGTIAQAVQLLTTELGTITTGTWNATAIADAYLDPVVHSAWDLTGTVAQAVQLLITELGTITTGTWQATVIGDAYLDPLVHDAGSLTNTLAEDVQNSIVTLGELTNNLSGGQQDATNFLDGSFVGDFNIGSNLVAGTGSATGQYAVAFGAGPTASGSSAVAEGNNTTASGTAAHAEGVNSTASGTAAHAEGNSTASGDYSHSEGSATTASGDYSHAAGQNATASNNNSYVWSDGIAANSEVANSWTAYATGGFRFLGGSMEGNGFGITNRIQALGTIPSTFTWNVSNRFASCTITGDVSLTITNMPIGFNALRVYCNGATGITSAASSFNSNSGRFYLVDSMTNTIQFINYGTGRNDATVENFDQ